MKATSIESQNSELFNKPNFRWLNSILAVLISIIYGIYEIVFIHGFFLHTFFRASISDVPPPIKLRVGYWNKLQFKAILLLRYLLKDQFWGQQWLKQVHQSILNNIEQQNINLSKLNMSIPVVEAGQISGKEFWEKYVKTCTPIIIKGGAKHTLAYKGWSLESFRERFGDFEVNITNQSNNEESDIKTFRDVVDSDEKLYISFWANIFSAHPELLDELGCLDFREHMGGKATHFIGTQIFLGAHSDTGTHPHCAQGSNLFFQIRGQKKWTFVHPDYSWLMYPMLDRVSFFCASFIKNNYDQAYLEQYAPLQKYCPKYEAVLDPGDILLNPPWQWHAVRNLTDENIAVAVRWAPAIGQKRANTFFEFIQLLSPYMWKVRFDVLKKQPNAVGVLDQKVDDAVKDKDDFVRLGNERRTVAWELDQWPEEYQF